MKICVIGTGYVGLTIGACFSGSGNEVVCIDIVKNKIDRLNDGIIPVYEPGLELLIKNNIKLKKLVFSTDLKEGIQKSQLIFITVGTPVSYNGNVDLNAVESVAAQIGQYINGYKIIINKSTVPVGTCKNIGRIIRKNIKNKKIDFDMVSNPEFLREGSAVKDFLCPDRIVAGMESKRPLKKIKDLYNSILINSKYNLVVTDLETAEMIKYVSNAFLAAKISFINEVSHLCELIRIDTGVVAYGTGLDNRIGSGFLDAGPGYGGSCLPGDLASLHSIANKAGYDFKIIKAVMNVNESHKLWIVRKIENKIKNLKNKTIGILGLSFKPDTDDMREAPSILIINELLKRGAKIKAFDPIAMNEAKKIFSSKIEFCDSSYSAAQNSDALVFITEWNEFRKIDFTKLKKLLRNKFIFDLRNIFEPDKIKKLGFEYIGTGRT